MNLHPDATKAQRRDRGQIIVIFAGAIFLLMMLSAVVVDISWYWVNSLRVQRAADAAALAGAVMLPNQPSSAYSLAREEATRNGYLDQQVVVGLPGNQKIIVTPLQDTNPRRLNVTIKAPVGTFFMRVIGIPAITVTRSSKAEFTLPVPMGSPQNYYGVGLLNLPTTQTVNSTSGWKDPNEESGSWVNPFGADDIISNNSSQWAISNVNGSGVSANDPQQQWLEFGMDQNPNAIPDVASLQVLGITVRTRSFLQGSGATTSGCQMQVQLSWNDGNSWTTSKNFSPLPTAPPPTTPLGATVPYNANFGGPADNWGHAWTYQDLTDTGNSSLRLRVTFENTTNCTNTRRLAIDDMEMLVTYKYDQAGPPVPSPVIAPDNTVLAPQFFWGAMQSQGAPSVQGDSYMTGYTTRKNATNPKYDPVQYYNYGIDMPAGGGQVWIYDPGFCDTAQSSGGINQGTGENWTVGGSNGNDSVQPVSAQYNLFRDDPNTPYLYTDDTFIGSSLNTFRRLSLSDPNLGGDNNAQGSCAGLSWHNGWWTTGTFQNLPAGRYRLHTSSRIFIGGNSKVISNVDNGDNQTDSTGLNAFAIWTKTSGTAAPRVYGLGAMEAYFPLSPNTNSTFYLAQIEAAHAGKWMDIDLWDPGDTGQLPANLEIRMPTAGGYTNAEFYYNSSTGTTLPSNFTCGDTTSAKVTSITTSTGSGGIYNGKWLRICIKLLDTYNAPQPSGETEPGWWKIRYNMGGTSGDNGSTDLTTWQVTIRGNPVHLIVP